MRDKFTIGTIAELRFWTQKVLPLVYDDSLSYYELLAKVIAKLNEVVEATNEIPDYIKGYINSDEFKNIISELLTDIVINVKHPPIGLKPATGDGTENDTEAIQGCIDYAHENGGGTVYLPTGSYLTNNLTMYDNVSLKGSSRYDTKIVLRGGTSTPFIGGVLENCGFYDLTIDGNADVQVNAVNLFEITAKDVQFSNLILTDGDTLLDITENGGHIQMDDIVCKRAVKQALRLHDADEHSEITVDNFTVESLSELSGVCELYISTSYGTFTNLQLNATVHRAVRVYGDNNFLQGTCRNSDSFIIGGEYNTVLLLGLVMQYNCKKLTLNPDEPLQYYEPQPYDYKFDYIPFQDGTDAEYKIPVLREVDVVYEVDTTENLLTSDYSVGTRLHTSGYYETNDGYGAYFIITSDNGIPMTNGNYALVLDAETIPEQFGVISNNYQTNWKDQMQLWANHNSIHSLISGKHYYFTGITVTLDESNPTFILNGNNGILHHWGSKTLATLNFEDGTKTHDVIIRDVTFTDKGSSNQNVPLRISAVNNCLIENCNLLSYVSTVEGDWQISFSGNLLNVDNCFIDSHEAGTWGDGIHVLQATKGVYVSNTYIYSGDDAIALYMGRGLTIPNGNIGEAHITNCTLKTDNYSALKIGADSEITRDYFLHDVYVNNCFIECDRALSFYDQRTNSTNKVKVFFNNCEIRQQEGYILSYPLFDAMTKNAKNCSLYINGSSITRDKKLDQFEKTEYMIISGLFNEVLINGAIVNMFANATSEYGYRLFSGSTRTDGDVTIRNSSITLDENCIVAQDGYGTHNLIIEGCTIKGSGVAFKDVGNNDVRYSRFGVVRNNILRGVTLQIPTGFSQSVYVASGNENFPS